jgi:hypothetical protein
VQGESESKSVTLPGDERIELIVGNMLTRTNSASETKRHVVVREEWIGIIGESFRLEFFGVREELI